MSETTRTKPRTYFGFGMLNIHLLNLPLACANTVFGDGARPLTPCDLWLGFVFIYVYSLVYLFFLDRLGVHLYPIFSPRSRFCFVAYIAVFGLFVLTHRLWSAVIMAHG